MTAQTGHNKTSSSTVQAETGASPATINQEVETSHGTEMFLLRIVSIVNHMDERQSEIVSCYGSSMETN